MKGQSLKRQSSNLLWWLTSLIDLLVDNLLLCLLVLSQVIAYADDGNVGGLEGSVTRMLEADPQFRNYLLPSFKLSLGNGVHCQSKNLFKWRLNKRLYIWPNTCWAVKKK